MATLKQRLRADMTTALKAKDEGTLGALRMALAAIATQEVAGKQARELSDDEVTAVLTTEVKRRREAAEAFAGADRPELAEKEQAEAEVLRRYLPEPLDDAELDALIAAAVANAAALGQSGGRAMGTVMKELKTATAGRVDGADLAARVKAALGPG